MDIFLKANPGLSSRFDKTLRFNDYTPAELEAISLSMLDDAGYKLSAKATGILHHAMTDIYTKRDKYFGNARYVRKVILEIIKNQNLRISSTFADDRKKNQLNFIQPEDLSTLAQVKESEMIHKKTIGFRSGDYK